MIKAYYQHEETGNIIDRYYFSKEDIKQIPRYFMYKTEEVLGIGGSKINKYIVMFSDEDSIRIHIDQNINRPNNPTDDEIIREYILNNYGEKEYEIIDLKGIKQIGL